MHIAAYNEPPEMLIETIRTAEGLRYPNFEIVVVDNNTMNADVWGPVANYCADRPNVNFVHVEPWPGYKSGALNLALRKYTDPEAEIVGVIDSDYLVDPSWLDETVGSFATPTSPLSRRPRTTATTKATHTSPPVTTRTGTSSPPRCPHATNATQSSLRARWVCCVEVISVLSKAGMSGASPRMPKRLSVFFAPGIPGCFIGKSFGRGIMPLTFTSLKSQRFRWCFGGMQILRRHWRSLMPWDRSPDNHLSIAQRFDYLIGGLQWMNDLVYQGFTVVLLTVAGLLLAGDTVPIRPLIGPTVLLPGVALATGLLRAIWALRRPLTSRSAERSWHF